MFDNSIIYVICPSPNYHGQKTGVSLTRSEIDFSKVKEGNLKGISEIKKIRFFS